MFEQPSHVTCRPSDRMLLTRGTEASHLSDRIGCVTEAPRQLPSARLPRGSKYTDNEIGELAYHSDTGKPLVAGAERYAGITFRQAQHELSRNTARWRIAWCGHWRAHVDIVVSPTKGVQDTEDSSKCQRGLEKSLP